MRDDDLRLVFVLSWDLRALTPYSWGEFKDKERRGGGGPVDRMSCLVIAIAESNLAVEMKENMTS